MYFGIDTYLLRGKVNNWCFGTMKMFDWLGMGFCLQIENECVDKHSIL